MKCRIEVMCKDGERMASPVMTWDEAHLTTTHDNNSGICFADAALEGGMGNEPVGQMMCVNMHIHANLELHGLEAKFGGKYQVWIVKPL